MKTVRRSLLLALALAAPGGAAAQARPPAFLAPLPAPVLTPARADAPFPPPVPPPFSLRPALGWTLDQFRIFGEDGWDVLTFWNELDRREALLFGGVLGVGGLLLAVDEPLQEMVERNTEWGPLNWFEEAGEFFDPLGHMGRTNKFYIGGWLVGAATGWDALERVSREILFSHYIAALTRQGVRDLVGRQRPFEGEGAYALGDGTSFPSGHASSIFQVASVLSDQLDWWPASVGLFTVAGVVSWERVSSGSHWPSDVWIGALWGWGVTHVVLRNAERREAEESAEREASTGGTLRVSLAPHALTGAPAIVVSVPLGGARSGR